MQERLRVGLPPLAAPPPLSRGSPPAPAATAPPPMTWPSSRSRSSSTSNSATIWVQPRFTHAERSVIASPSPSLSLPPPPPPPPPRAVPRPRPAATDANIVARQLPDSCSGSRSRHLSDTRSWRRGRPASRAGAVSSASPVSLAQRRLSPARAAHRAPASCRGDIGDAPSTSSGCSSAGGCCGSTKGCCRSAAAFQGFSRGSCGHGSAGGSCGHRSAGGSCDSVKGCKGLAAACQGSAVGSCGSAGTAPACCAGNAAAGGRASGGCTRMASPGTPWAVLNEIAERCGSCCLSGSPPGIGSDTPTLHDQDSGAPAARKHKAPTSSSVSAHAPTPASVALSMPPSGVPTAAPASPPSSAPAITLAPVPAPLLPSGLATAAASPPSDRSACRPAPLLLGLLERAGRCGASCGGSQVPACVRGAAAPVGAAWTARRRKPQSKRGAATQLSASSSAATAAAARGTPEGEGLARVWGCGSEWQEGVACLCASGRGGARVEHRFGRERFDCCASPHLPGAPAFRPAPGSALQRMKFRPALWTRPSDVPFEPVFWTWASHPPSDLSFGPAL
eukprot:356258-Chlamydomonas_euryale.AAC.2